MAIQYITDLNRLWDTLVKHFKTIDKKNSLPIKKEFNKIRAKYDRKEIGFEEYEKVLKNIKKKYHLDNYDKQMYFLFKDEKFHHHHIIEKTEHFVDDFVEQVESKIGRTVGKNFIKVNIGKEYVSLEGYIWGQNGKAKVNCKYRNGFWFKERKTVVKVLKKIHIKYKPMSEKIK